MESVQTYRNFCFPLTDITLSHLKSLQNDLEYELEQLEQTTQTNNKTNLLPITDPTILKLPTTTIEELSLGLIALQLLQSLFLRLTSHQANKYLAILESQETAQRAAHLVEGTGLLKVSLTSANIMPLTLNLRKIITQSSPTSSSLPSSPLSTSRATSPVQVQAPSTTDDTTETETKTETETGPTNTTDLKPSNQPNQGELVLNELAMTPYAACLLQDDADMHTTQEDLDREDKQHKINKIQHDNHLRYNNIDVLVNEPDDHHHHHQPPPTSLQQTPSTSPTNTTPGNISTRATTPLVTRRIRQFEKGNVTGLGSSTTQSPFSRISNNNSPPPPSPMRGTGAGLIGVDRHPPAQYPLPGQWMSPYHRAVSDDKKIALERDYLGLDIATHGGLLHEYKGTGDYLPMAKWLGSLRNNSEYRQHLEGAPPGIAEAVGVRMVQPPMHYSTASESMRSRTSNDKNNHNLQNVLDEKLFDNEMRTRMNGTETGIAYDDVTRTILSDDYNENVNGHNVPSSLSPDDIIHRGKRPTKIISERRARRRRAQRAINDCGGKIGIDHHEPSLYPLPGQYVSRFHRSSGKDKARALARPYVGMNMNQMRRHISTGNGDGKAASNWIGSLRSKAKGADGGYMEYMHRVEEQRRKGVRNENEHVEQETNRNRESNEEGNDYGGTEKMKNISTDMMNSDQSNSNNRNNNTNTLNTSKRSNKFNKSNRRNERNERNERNVRNVRNPGKTQYMGNKTQAQMNGVPVNMRWMKPNEYGDTTKGYLRMQDRLYRPSLREVANKFALRDDTCNIHGKTGTRLNCSNDLSSKKSQEEQRRRRRMEYGNAYAQRFKRKTKVGGWVD